MAVPGPKQQCYNRIRALHGQVPPPHPPPRVAWSGVWSRRAVHGLSCMLRQRRCHSTPVLRRRPPRRVSWGVTGRSVGPENHPHPTSAGGSVWSASGLSRLDLLRPRSRRPTSGSELEVARGRLVRVDHVRSTRLLTSSSPWSCAPSGVDTAGFPGRCCCRLYRRVVVSAAVVALPPSSPSSPPSPSSSPPSSPPHPSSPSPPRSSRRAVLSRSSTPPSFPPPPPPLPPPPRV